MYSVLHNSDSVVPVVVAQIVFTSWWQQNPDKLTVYLCVCLCVGVNLLVGTESGLMLLDRSGQGKVYPLINRRRFQQMDVLEGLNVLVTISGTHTHTHSHTYYEIGFITPCSQMSPTEIKNPILFESI